MRISIGSGSFWLGLLLSWGLVATLATGGCNPTPPAAPETSTPDGQARGDGGGRTDAAHPNDRRVSPDSPAPNDAASPTDTAPPTDAPVTRDAPSPSDRAAPPEPPSGEPPVAPKNTCYGLLVCAQGKCQWPYPVPCLDRCANDVALQGDALKRYQDMRSCALKNCSTGVCQGQDQECYRQCMAAYCSKAYLSCASDGQVGATTCKLTAACIEKCGKGQSACHARCLQAASKTAQETYVKASECAGLGYFKKLTPAQEASCYRSYVACSCPEYAQEGAGTSTCEGYSKCVSPCGSDICCHARCRHQTSKNELQAADKANQCFQKHCSACKGAQPCQDQCVATYCIDSWRSCLCPRTGSPGQGKQGCRSAFTCFSQCPANDTCCAFSCLHGLSKKGFNLYQDLSQCTPKCGCKNGDKACNDKCVAAGGLCHKEATACYNDHP